MSPESPAPPHLILRTLRCLRGPGNSLGLTPDALAILLSLADEPKGKSLARIRERAGIPKPASLYSAGVLTQADLITSHAQHLLSPSGLIRRNLVLTLTPAGRDYLHHILSTP